MTQEHDHAFTRKRGRPPEAERFRRREDIVDAAVALFASEGFEAVTLDRIATAAHVAKRTIYTHLGDRTEVFLAAVEHLRERALHEAAPEEGLEGLATNIVLALHSDDAVALHRLAIGEGPRFPELAVRFYEDGPIRYIAALRDRLPEPDDRRAEELFGLLLGEKHRQRLLGLRPAPDATAAAAHARTAILALGLSESATREEK
ncbi:MAG: TetR/AcrR family transcriptional regulator [Leifsonia sp.]